jgi:hypothetical protein
MPAATQPVNFTLSGNIYDEYDRPLANFVVKVHDIDLRSEQLLADTKTDAKGYYSITFNAEVAANPEYLTIDIRLTIFNEAGKALGQSPIYFNVQTGAVINYKLGNTTCRGTNEFDDLVIKATSITKQANVQLGQLEENDKFKDISFIAGELGESLEKITWLNTAFAISKSTKVAPDIFYALFRMGLPTDLNELLMIKSEAISNALTGAIDKNIISSKWLKEPDAIIKLLNELSARQVFKSTSSKLADFRNIISLALTAPQQQQFVNAFFANESTPENFWQQLKQDGVPESEIKKTQQVLRLTLLTGYQPELTKQLFNNNDIAAQSDIRNLSALDNTEWEELIKKAEVKVFPPGIEGATPDEKTKNYADALATTIKRLYPASVFSERLKKDNQSFGGLKQDISIFLSNNPDFNLSTNNPGEDFKKSTFDGIAGDKVDALKSEMKNINRLYKLSNDYVHVAALYTDKLHSATNIVHNHSLKSFTKKFGDKLGPDKAKSIYLAARETDRKSTALALSFQKKSDTHIYVMHGKVQQLSPDLQSLFGNDNNCYCDHCQSVYSPSAYLVDILNFLRIQSPEAYAKLDTMRPDIKEILLTCENTNTPLPYIDLVNEILEDKVSPPNPVAWHQTTLTAGELAAFPEHSNTAAYDILAVSSSSPVLPLNLPLEQTRQWLEKASQKRVALMEMFYGNKPVSKYSDISIAREYLQLSAQEAGILITPAATEMDKVTDLLQATGIDYVGLLQLLESYYINPAVGDNKRQIIIAGPDTNPASCDISELKLTGATATSKKRVIPFIRLWRKTGWSMIDLDKAFTAFGVTDLTDDVIIKISHVARLKALYHLDVARILAFWTNIDTRSYLDQASENHPALESLYDQLFLNKKTRNPVDENFRNPAALAGNLHDVIPLPLPGINNPATIISGLNLTQENFETLVPLTNGALNLTNLSFLYRYGLFTRCLKLQLDDFLTLVDLTGINPFTGSTETIFLFIDKFNIMRSSGFSIPELRSLLTVSPDNLVDPDIKTKARLSRLLTILKITTEEYVYLHDEANATRLHLTGIWQLPAGNLYEPFENLLGLILFRNLVKPGIGWFKLFDLANAGDFVTSFSKLINIATEDATFLFQYLNYVFPVDYVSGIKLYELAICGKTITKMGTSAEKLTSLLGADIIAENAKLAFSLLRARYDEQSWPDVIKPLSNQLRSRQRNALSAYLVATNPAFTDTDDLYEYFLIDTEVAVCMLTSRIKQAISSVQLFIDRCLLNLEEGIEPDMSFAKQWNTWRKMYRVWEANRKIFLYPENWIEPELRDNKTSLFRDIESKLKQADVTDEVVTEALLGYLEKLDAIAEMECMGVFADPETRIVHVTARTKTSPHDHYYRYQKNNTWSNWEKIDIDVEGEQVLLTVWNNRVIIFWGTFQEKQKEVPFKTPKAGDVMEEPLKYFEMKLNWCENKNGKWKKKKVSKQKAELIIGMPLSGLSLNSSIQSAELWITGYWGNLSPSTEYINSLGLFSFIFDGCNSEPHTILHRFGNSPYYTTLPKMHSDNMLIAENRSSADIKFDVFSTGLYRDGTSATVTLFNNTPGKFYVMPEHQAIAKNESVHFFYNNDKNIFYAYSVAGFRLPDITINTSGLLFLERVVPAPPPVLSISVGSGSTFIPERVSTTADILPPLSVSGLTGNISLSVIGHLFFGKKYIFKTFYHPYVCSFIKHLNSEGIAALYKEEIQNRDIVSIFSNTSYAPTANVRTPFPVEKIDFDITGTYSAYNWELFFHIPLLMATNLSRNQKFSEAQTWFHYIFNPTKSTDDPNEGVERFWITKPFKDEILNGSKTIEELLNGTDPTELDAQLTNWENNPFNPHSVARLRISAYMRTTVIKYIDNLIAWGDQLFQRDTLESINEATLLYIMAANILGPKSVIIPARTITDAQSFDSIKDKLDRFSNAKIEIQSYISPSGETDTDPDAMPLVPMFCLPPNDKLLGYWDLVANRLFKIRNCMNIQGVVRQLPLFEPPIDPGLLVKAAAAGIDLATVIDDINVDLPFYRFQVILQTANELCNDVKSLGANLLSALEKGDAEELALIRSGHESKMIQLVRDIREAQYNEAIANLNSFNSQKESIVHRRDYYSSRTSPNSSENEFFSSSRNAMVFQEIQQGADLAAGLLFTVPEATVGAWSWGITTGGHGYGSAATALGRLASGFATYFSYSAAMANTKGGFNRRQDDWIFQTQSAEKELKQIDKQIVAAELRVAMAEKELENHDIQIENSQEIDDYLHNKFTNTELYEFMTGQISVVYFQTYQLAYTMAKRAEKCLQHELGLQDTNYIRFGYWDSLRKGLVSGEKLQFDLRRLQNAYLESNKRDFEMTRHISLALMDPFQLLELKETGVCTFNLPEELFDLDFPGHYFRRIKSVSISVPCVAGPYTSINATLSLQGNKYRFKADDPDDYVERPDEVNTATGRFRSIVPGAKSIATSSAQNDSGMFELNFRDERYLPFEGAGAISSWRLELMTEKDLRQFDYDSISDIILHMSYTAREDNALKNAAIGHLKEYFNIEGAASGNFARIISLKQEFPDSWYQLMTSTPQKTEMTITKNHFNRLFSTHTISINSAIVFAFPKDGTGLNNLPVLKFAFEHGGVAVNTASWEDFGGDGRKATLASEGTNPLGKLAIEVESGGLLNSDEIADLLLFFNFKLE